MSIITHAIATEVAKKLTSKKEKELKKAEAFLNDMITEMYTKTLDSDLLAVFEKFPAYFKTVSYFSLQGNGFNYEHVNVSRSLPKRSDYFNPSEKDAPKLRKALDAKYSKAKELQELRAEIERTLISLRSYKKIKDFFPEASAFLPEKITTALAVNVSDIRARLQ